MKHRYSLFVYAIIVATLLTSLACGLSGGSTSSDSTIRQWASNVSASSEFGTGGRTAQQAAGAPDTKTCGDQTTAWASAYSDGVDWLDAGFATSVVPTQINIYETYTPGSIVKVEVRDTDGSFHTVWEGTPNSVSQCPRVFTVNVSNVDFKVTSVLISVDQTVLGDWDEIDAVELVGKP